MADYAMLLRDHVTLTCRSVDRRSPLAQAWKQLIAQLDRFIGHGLAPA
jgi:hypothetical protein